MQKYSDIVLTSRNSYDKIKYEESLLCRRLLRANN